jgi:alanine dehydrogenase
MEGRRMRIGIPREIKDGEARVGATPDSVRILAGDGHQLLVETGAGLPSGFDDASYRAAGAEIAAAPEAVYACPLVAKVKELQPPEFDRLQPGTLVAGYHQLARDPRLLDAVLRQRVTCLAYEGVLGEEGGRPLLAPMSTIAGTMTAQIAAWVLQRRPGPLCGSGVLLPRLEGVPPAQVLVLGEGVAGTAAARTFLAIGCEVTVLGKDPGLLRRLEERLASPGPGRLRTGLSETGELARAVARADVVVGAVSVPGHLSPKLITRAMLGSMRPGSAFVDIGIDMGGIAETSRQTYLSDPLYVEEGVLHYCVPNIPALVPRTATQALAEATLPYLRLLAREGLPEAIAARPGLGQGLLVHDGRVVHPALAGDTGRPFTPYSA